MFPGGVVIGEGLGVMDMASMQGAGNAIASGVVVADSLVKVMVVRRVKSRTGTRWRRERAWRRWRRR